jgi:hypothetical protein
VAVAGKRVSVLLCGELFNWRARHGVARVGANVILDLGHSGMGQGLIPAMRSLSAEGKCAVGHSQHLSGWYGRNLHFLDAREEQRSVAVEENRLLKRGSLWAGWAVREL